jgi:hypothetical protein
MMRETEYFDLLEIVIFHSLISLQKKYPKRNRAKG